jgi:hypothetical protein
MTLGGVQQVQQAAATGTAALQKGAGLVAAGAPGAVLAPFTAGQSLLPAMAMMGGAGLAGGALREGVERTLGSTGKTGTELAKDLALDTFLGGVGEGAARGLATFAGSMIPKLVQRSAAKTETGQNLLEMAFTQGRQKLYDVAQAAGNPSVNVEGALRQAYDGLAKIPKGSGPVGQRFSGLTPKAAELLQDIGDQLALAKGGVSSEQPLDALIRIKGSVSQAAWKEATLAPEERQVFKTLAGKLDESLRPALKAAGGDDAVGLLNDVNQIAKTQRQYSVGLDLMERALRSGAGRAAIGAVTGGAYGGVRGGPTGAVEGAIGGAVAGAVTNLPRQAATWALERAMNNPEAAQAMKNAINSYIGGREGQAGVLASRAFALSGVREHLKDFFTNASQETAPAPVSP